LVELRKAGEIPDALLLLEHPPVITLGRNARRDHVLASDEVLAQRGVELYECDRGGDVTYHGPGQLVGYPIFDLRQLRSPEDAGKALGAVAFVRRLEEVLIRTCGEFGVPATRVAGLTGVWTDQPEPEKIAAIGIHISRGVTSHGFAINVATAMDDFRLIVPCGLHGRTVTSLERESTQSISLHEVAESITRNFGRVFERQVLWVDTLDALLGRSVGVPMKVPDAERKTAGDHDESLWA
jgi:lipoyl(octanoyl) transferase